jgi:7,8-dihydropterin-6-yl-methyl-4-(beta-D-ribofuranosyl)aminobenzene 5'-phosphate synthase
MQHNRRSFLCAGGAAILSAMSRGPAVAQLGQVDVPSVEWLAVRIVAVTNRPPVEHKAEPKNSRDSQASAFQLAISPSNYFDREVAIHVQSASGPDMRNFLIDPCSDPRVLLEYMDQFRIEPDSLDALVLSNGNQRHLRALHDFLSATNGSLKKGMDVIIGR